MIPYNYCEYGASFAIFFGSFLHFVIFSCIFSQIFELFDHFSQKFAFVRLLRILCGFFLGRACVLPP